jgi:uncharacterized protein
MFFETAGIQVTIWIPPLVAFVISFFTSMGGLSGAFLLLPFQMSFLNFTNPSVSATNQLYNVVAIPSGVYRYWREGRMVWPLSLIVIIGTLPGVFIGAITRVKYLHDPGHFKLFAAIVLLYIALKMVTDLLYNRYSNKQGISDENQSGGMPGDMGFNGMPAEKTLPKIRVISLNRKHINFAFSEQTYEISCSGVFILSFIVGIIGGIYGIGGGAIIAPFFITFFRLPVYIVAGASLLGNFVTSLAGVAFYQAIALFLPSTHAAPDWQLGMLFGIGGMFGMYLGARCQKYVPAKYIKLMLTLVMIYTSIRYVIDFIISILK